MEGDKDVKDTKDNKGEKKPTYYDCGKSVTAENAFYCHKCLTTLLVLNKAEILTM